MEWLSRLLAGVTATLAFVGFSGVSLSTPATAPKPAPAPLLVRLDAPETPPSTTLPAAPATAHCPQWWGLAQETGWTPDLLPTLDYVLWRESRCQPEAHNTTLNRDKSTDIGLTQINDRSWCLPTRWYPNGYLQTIGVVPTVGCEQLFDPRINLLSAKAIYDYAQTQNGNGWSPWSL
jgi:hypothetical protein